MELRLGFLSMIRSGFASWVQIPLSSKFRTRESYDHILFAVLRRIAVILYQLHVLWLTIWYGNPCCSSWERGERFFASGNSSTAVV